MKHRLHIQVYSYVGNKNYHVHVLLQKSDNVTGFTYGFLQIGNPMDLSGCFLIIKYLIGWAVK